MFKKSEQNNKIKPTVPTFRQLWRSLATILPYQVASAVLLLLGSQGLQLVIAGVMRITGRRALSWSDVSFIFFNPWGWLILALGAALLAWYVAFDLNVKILYSGQLLRGQRQSMWATFVQAAMSLKKLGNWRGLLLIVYIGLLAPLVGAHLTISLTEQFRLPNFIQLVIDSTPWLWAVYFVVMMGLFIVGSLYVFCLHGMLLDGETLAESCRWSRQTMAKHWRSIFWQQIKYNTKIILTVVLALITMIAVPVVVLSVWRPEQTDWWEVFWSLAGAIIGPILTSIGSCWLVLNLTHVYQTYRDGQERSFVVDKHRHLRWWLLGLVVGLGLLMPLSWLIVSNIDQIFEEMDDVLVVAHRAAGNEGVENSLSGLQYSIDQGTYGVEFDIQRTSDGHYVVNHDNTFARMTGVDKSSTQMTLAEVQTLCLQDARSKPDVCEPPATLEQFLDTARGKITLFIELKGETADEQMVDDVVAMVKERGMEREVYLTSIERPAIEYADRVYPEMQTVYVSFVGYGEISSLPGDVIALEESAMTSSALADIHSRGKQAIVWTPDKRDSLDHFLRTQVDILYTDEVTLAKTIVDEINHQSPLERIVDLLNE
ncbi:glycerophosphoryl diester phosphodiesterase membrane domain-containing protein [bacterium]|nr:glycerophosphoryl diester phosphodiesterase membrane domain-containing protein [bacterium]